MCKICSVLLLLLLSHSYGQSTENGREKAETLCAVCHGINGQASSAGNSAIIPNLTAQNKLYLIEKLKDYKSGKLQHHQMSFIAHM